MDTENLLIAYLWRLIRETHSESDTKDGRTKLGYRQTNILEQYDFLKSLIENLSIKFLEISPYKIDSYVHNQLSHFYGCSLKSSSIHNKLVEALVQTKITNNNLKIISANLLLAYKEVLYSYHFSNTVCSIQDETIKRAKELCQGIGDNFFTNESPATFWNRKKSNLQIANNEIEIIFENPTGLSRLNFKYLIQKRYENGFPVFLIRNFESKSIKEYLNRLPSNQLANNKLESVILETELKDDYLKFIDELRRLKLFIKSKVTDEIRIVTRANNLSELIQKQDNDINVATITDVNTITSLESEKLKLNQRKKDLIKRNDDSKLDLEKIKSIKAHLIDNKNTKEISSKNEILNSLGFFVLRTKETENMFDNLLKTAKIHYKVCDRRTLRSIMDNTYLEVDRILDIESQIVNIEISDPQHFGGSKFVIKRDENKIKSIVENQLYPFIFISYCCLEDLQKLNIEKILNNIAKESLKNEVIIEIFRDKTLSKYIQTDKFKSVNIKEFHCEI